jgi:hypothetical protein
MPPGISPISPVGTVAEPRPGSSLAELAMWPPGVTASLGDFILRQPESVACCSCSTSLQQLARLADAMLANVRADGTVLDAPRFQSLKTRSQAILAGLTGTFPAEWNDYIAAAAQSGDAPGQACVPRANHPALGQTDVFLHCGPLATWTSKTVTQHHSVLAATRNPAWTGFYQQADLLLPGMAAGAGQVLGVELSWNREPTVIFPADLIACGGEANTVPKNFAYFLPEDAGNSTGQAATVLFSEFYIHRFLGISLPLLKTLATSLAGPPEPAMAAALHLWFRGHDVGHFISPYGTLQRRHVLSSWMYGILDELWADVIGYVVAISPAAESLIGDAGDVSRLAFLAELLRYVRRGAAWFIDSAAAAVELAALEANGAIHFDRSSRTLTWSAELMDAAMIGLGTRLVRLLFGEVRSEDTALLDPLSHGSSDLAEFLTGTIHAGQAGSLPYDYRYV